MKEKAARDACKKDQQSFRSEGLGESGKAKHPSDEKNPNPSMVKKRSHDTEEGSATFGVWGNEEEGHLNGSVHSLSPQGSPGTVSGPTSFLPRRCGLRKILGWFTRALTPSNVELRKVPTLWDALGK